VKEAEEETGSRRQEAAEGRNPLPPAACLLLPKYYNKLTEGEYHDYNF